MVIVLRGWICVTLDECGATDACRGCDMGGAQQCGHPDLSAPRGKPRQALLTHLAPRSPDLGTKHLELEWDHFWSWKWALEMGIVLVCSGKNIASSIGGDMPIQPL